MMRIQTTMQIAERKEVSLCDDPGVRWKLVTIRRLCHDQLCQCVFSDDIHALCSVAPQAHALT
jgi:hypothetical protein